MITPHQSSHLRSVTFRQTQHFIKMELSKSLTWHSYAIATSCFICLIRKWSLIFWVFQSKYLMTASSCRPVKGLLVCLCDVTASKREIEAATVKVLEREQTCDKYLGLQTLIVFSYQWRQSDNCSVRKNVQKHLYTVIICNVECWGEKLLHIVCMRVSCLNMHVLQQEISKLNPSSLGTPISSLQTKMIFLEKHKTGWHGNYHSFLANVIAKFQWQCIASYQLWKSGNPSPRLL